MWKTPDLRVRPTGSASGGPEQPRYGQLAAWPVVPSLTPPLFYEYYFLPSCPSLSLWSAFERVWVLALSVTGSVRLSGLREGLTRGLLVMERLTVRGYRVTRSRARGGGVRSKERNVHASGPTGSASASSSGPGYGQWPGIRRPGTVWPVNPALFST